MGSRIEGPNPPSLSSASGQAQHPPFCRIKKAFLDHLSPERQAAIQAITVRNILLVDDEPTNIRLGPRLGVINNLPIKVETVGPGLGIAAKLQAQDISNISLVLLDGELPDTDGVALTQILRQRGFTGIIVSISSNPSKGKAMVAAGADFWHESASHGNKFQLSYLEERSN